MRWWWESFLETYRYTLDKLLPDGLGTRAILALVIVGYGITKLPTDEIIQVVILVGTAYFALKKVGGNGAGGT